MKKVLLFLACGLFASSVAFGSPRMITRDLLFTDGATTALTVTLLHAQGTTITYDTDTTTALDLSSYNTVPDTTMPIGILNVWWPYTSAGGKSNDGDSLYFAWRASIDDTIYVDGPWSVLTAADSTTTAPIYKYKLVTIRFGIGSGVTAGTMTMPYGYRYYKLMVRNGSVGANVANITADLYTVKARLRLKQVD